MPLPLKTNPLQKSGPKPTCTCGDCPKCKNRERQRRFYDNQRLRIEPPLLEENEEESDDE